MVDPQTAKSTYNTLSGWKVASAAAPASDNYTSAQKTVNAWIEQKKSEVTIAGAGAFDQVDLTIPDDLAKKVTTAGIGARGGAEDIADAVISYLFKKYEAARKQQATEISARLDLYKWEEKK